MRTYTFTAPATGAGVPFSVVGSFVRYYSNSAGAANPALVIKTDRGDSFELAPNEKIKVTRQFKSLLVYNRDLVADISGKLIIGEGDFSANTFSGSVAVTSVPAPLNDAVSDAADGQPPLGAASMLPVLARMAALDVGGNWSRLQAYGPSDSFASYGALVTLGYGLKFNGSGWDRSRTPAHWTYNLVAPAVAPGTAIWTPAAGKKIRLMGFDLAIPTSMTMAVAQEVTFALTDGAGGPVVWGTRIALNTVVAYGPPLLEKTIRYNGNGYLSAAANNALCLYATVAPNAGNVLVNVWGTEE